RRFRGLRDLGRLQPPDRGGDDPPPLLRPPPPVAPLLALLPQGLPTAGGPGAAQPPPPALARAPPTHPPPRAPGHLLLLPQGLLPVVLAVAAGLRGCRAAREVLRRDALPAHRPEHPPIRLVLRRHLRRDPHLGRRHRVQLRRELRHRGRQRDPRDQ